MDFKNLLNDYSLEAIDISQFLLNALIGALLSWLVSLYYKRYGSSVSNRSQFADNFILLALTTMLIITIVKSSIALSLGLVGALSIVRFRAAIKEPEELIYLFLVIAIGLGMGADQAAITIVAFVLIMSILIIKSKVSGKSGNMRRNQMQLAITTDPIDVESVNTVLSENIKIVDLKRMSQNKEKVYLSYALESESFDNLIAVKDQLLALSPSMEISFVDNSNVAG
ncbi:MAG: hypothetical protein ACI9P5_001809 [Saprospiraceae bacterium]|jgi:uncharacterized membrane protein YhiD involved in acid resistance|tara:strand:- start:2392 stop:3069 length:678 start_codon:yes stop_codon:yes gene_type:complete